MMEMEEEKDSRGLRFSITLVEVKDYSSNSPIKERFYEFHSHELNYTWRIDDINVQKGELIRNGELKYSFLRLPDSNPNNFIVYDSEGEEVLDTVIGWEGRDIK